MKTKQLRAMPFCMILSSFFLHVAVVLFGSVTAEDQVTYLDSICSEGSQYNQGSRYQTNLDLLLSNLTSEATTNNKKFYNISTGDGPNRVYGLFLCNSVYINQVCQVCITLAQGEIQRRCPSSREAIVWYTECMLRYADHSIFSLNDFSVYTHSETGPVKYSEYNQQLTDTFISLFSQATSGNSSYAATVVYVSTDVSVSCYVDCTPDLSPSDCSRCLRTAIGRLQTGGYQAGVLLQPSCRLMYAFNDIGSFTPGKELYIALGVVSIVAAASLSLNVIVCFKRKKVAKKPIGIEEIESMENLHFEFDTIKAATDDFSPANKLGQGGFGMVYMGTLGDEQAIAVKRLSNASGQGIREFKTEACLAAKLQHKNLVKLFGFCSEKEEMLLVYEYVPNKSLDRYLFDKRRGSYLKWETRYTIIVGIARGLLYLHEDSRPKIIHRDLKPSNILLDAEMNPKIADFGMAKLFGVDQTQGNTSRVAGTFGYMAPEYATTGHFSTKSDIFSYGVILLEILSGQRNSMFDPNTEADNLLNYAWRLWDEGTPLKLLDSALGTDNISKIEVERCIKVALLCIQEDPAKRPNIASVLLMLNTQPITLPPHGSPPAFPIRPGKQTASFVNSATDAEADITDLSAR